MKILPTKLAPDGAEITTLYQTPPLSFYHRRRLLDILEGHPSVKEASVKLPYPQRDIKRPLVLVYDVSSRVVLLRANTDRRGNRVRLRYPDYNATMTELLPTDFIRMVVRLNSNDVVVGVDGNSENEIKTPLAAGTKKRVHSSQFDNEKRGDFGKSKGKNKNKRKKKNAPLPGQIGLF